MKKIFFLLLLFFCLPLWAQPDEINYDEAKVPAYTLPDPLVFADGTPVIRETWPYRRHQILRLFEAEIYGRMPSERPEISFELLEQGAAFDNSATRKQVRVYLLGRKPGPFMDVLIYLPAKRPVPLFVGLNFDGNHTICDDPAVRLPESRMPDDAQMGVSDLKADEAGRGKKSRRWPVREILARGYGLATIYYGDIDPDEDRLDNGIHPYFYKEGQTRPAADEWGSIGAWAWGLSRAMDYFEKDADIAADKVAVMGHSRLGKTALWAGATDERFALVISNNSGCGGAALSRRRFGETVKRINTVFPHWFCGNFKRYNDAEESLPVDQHMLLTLIAPRPLYVASAEEDLWADPRGEFLAAKCASPVYRLLGLEGLPAAEMPPLNQPVMGSIGYHIRSGGHDVTLYDWQRFMDFADLHGLNR